MNVTDEQEILLRPLAVMSKKHKHRLAVHFKKHAAIPQTSCTHESELQLSF